MSGRSPKALLPSSLSLSSIRQALPTHKPTPSAAGKYPARPVSTATATATASKQPRRPPSPGAVGSGAGAGTVSVARQPSGRAPPRAAGHGSRDSGALLVRGGNTLGGGYFDPSGSARGFATTARSSHQQAVTPSSSGLPPLPGGAGGSGSSGSSNGSAGPSKAASLVRPSSHADGDALILAPSDAYQPPEAVPSAPSSSTSQPSSSSTPTPPATLFSSPPPPSFPPHALPSFFGSALSIARRSNLVFRNGAYGIPKPQMGRARVSSRKGKERELLPGDPAEEHYLSVGVGEDAYFLRSDSLGVADGVGGWSGHAGANSARWARKFMHHCSYELARYENVEDELFLNYYEVDPVDVMQRAFEKTLAECKEEGTIGSSTALLAVLRNDELRLANLGDCACCVIRGSSYIFRTEEQQHQFNFPFQAGTNAKDTPAKDAQRFTIPVKRDDIVILASDGLVDNVFSDDLLEEVLRFVGSNSPLPASPSSSPSTAPGQFSLRRFSPQAVSEALCFRAKSVYDDQRAVASPFQQRAMEEGIHYAGGKIDDVSCLVGVVGELEASPNRRDVT
ncbi:hypothetical protein JCM10213_007617 [Rhodosporidiobolus nylandii]